MRKIVVGVMGPGEGAKKHDIENAYKLGILIAQQNWILLTGGRKEGVMHAVNEGAKSAAGLTIGIIPTADRTDVSDFVDIAVITGMGSARNNINVLSCDVVVACGMGAGTASEVALALKAKKQVVLLTNQLSNEFFKEIGGMSIHSVSNPEEVIETCKTILAKR